MTQTLKNRRSVALTTQVSADRTPPTPRAGAAVSLQPLLSLPQPITSSASGRALQPGEVRAVRRVRGGLPKETGHGGTRRRHPGAAVRLGLRRAETVGLDVADYDRDSGTLKVRGKGNKERLAHLGDASQAALEAWLAVRGFWPGALFVSINKGGKLGTGGMSGQSMLYIARRRTVQASVAAFSPHDLRRTWDPAQPVSETSCRNLAVGSSEARYTDG